MDYTVYNPQMYGINGIREINHLFLRKRNYES